MFGSVAERLVFLDRSFQMATLLKTNSTQTLQQNTCPPLDKQNTCPPSEKSKASEAAWKHDSSSRVKLMVVDTPQGRRNCSNAGYPYHTTAAWHRGDNVGKSLGVLCPVKWVKHCTCLGHWAGHRYVTLTDQLGRRGDSYVTLTNRAEEVIVT